MLLESFIFINLKLLFLQNINNSLRKLLIPSTWSSNTMLPEPVDVKSSGSKVPLKNIVFKLSSTPAATKCLSCTAKNLTPFVPVTVTSEEKKF